MVNQNANFKNLNNGFDKQKENEILIQDIMARNIQTEEEPKNFGFQKIFRRKFQR